jgi:hypothetical protein
LIPSGATGLSSNGRQSQGIDNRGYLQPDRSLRRRIRGELTGDSDVPRSKYCFVAGQSVGHIALLGPAQGPPAYAGLLIGAVSDGIDEIFVPPFHRTLGDPRAPPVFSV